MQNLQDALAKREQTGAVAAHDEIRRLARVAGTVVDAIPERAAGGSPRYAETRSLRSTSGGGGVARAELLNLLNVDMQVMVGHLILAAGGAADDLEIASQRDNKVNGPALAFVVRPALELAGQIAWMLNDQIDAEHRARRYVVWRLADLRSQRLLLRDFRASSDETDAAVAELDESEDEILAVVAAAKWGAQPTRYNGGDIQAATLLGVEDRPEHMPSLGALVREVSSTPSTYGLLSVTSHSQRFGVLQGLEVVGAARDGQQNVRVGGFPLKTNLLIGLAVLALTIPGRMLGGWNGIDTRQLHSFGSELIERAGLR